MELNKADRDALYHLYLMKINQIAMMKVRGYRISNEEIEISEMTFDSFLDYIDDVSRGNVSNDFVDKVLSYKGIIKDVKSVLLTTRGMMSNEYTKEGRKIASCSVIYITRIGDGRIEKSFTSSIINVLKPIYTEIIIISDRELTPDSRHIFNSIPMVNVGLPRTAWLFKDEELYNNPLTHKLYSPHEILPDAEAKKFRKKYTNPLLISSDDPVVKFYGWKINSVIKITRDVSSINSNVKKLVTKRLVVRGIIVRDVIE